MTAEEHIARLDEKTIRCVLRHCNLSTGRFIPMPMGMKFGDDSAKWWRDRRRTKNNAMWITTIARDGNKLKMVPGFIRRTIGNEKVWLDSNTIKRNTPIIQRVCKRHRVWLWDSYKYRWVAPLY